MAPFRDSDLFGRFGLPLSIWRIARRVLIHYKTTYSDFRGVAFHRDGTVLQVNAVTFFSDRAAWQIFKDMGFISIKADALMLFQESLPNTDCHISITTRRSISRLHSHILSKRLVWGTLTYAVTPRPMTPFIRKTSWPSSRSSPFPCCARYAGQHPFTLERRRSAADNDIADLRSSSTYTGNGEHLSLRCHARSLALT